MMGSLLEQLGQVGTPALRHSPTSTGCASLLDSPPSVRYTGCNRPSSMTPALGADLPAVPFPALRKCTVSCTYHTAASRDRWRLLACHPRILGDIH